MVMNGICTGWYGWQGAAALCVWRVCSQGRNIKFNMFKLTTLRSRFYVDNLGQAVNAPQIQHNDILDESSYLNLIDSTDMSRDTMYANPAITR
ncbi:hypothetical protein N7523_007778 [Penicillium sp. IBT 18751x]|nr:hypothetical protein N7523_007778 [Penicillium sp. IBT 18751x]